MFCTVISCRKPFLFTGFTLFNSQYLSWVDNLISRSEDNVLWKDLFVVWDIQAWGDFYASINKSIELLLYQPPTITYKVISSFIRR